MNQPTGHLTLNIWPSGIATTKEDRERDAVVEARVERVDEAWEYNFLKQ